MRVWLDDKRVMPDGFDIHVMTAWEAIELVKTGKVTKIGLDHDLGDERIYGTGHHVSDFIEESAYYNKIPRLEWSIQSANGPEACGRMLVALRRADVYWDNHAQSEST